MTIKEQFLTNLELIKAVQAEPIDEVDKLLERNGVLYNSEEEFVYQDEHESGVDWNSRNEDEDR